MTITDDEQFTDVFTSLEGLMFRAQGVVNTLNMDTIPGQLIFVEKNGLSPEAIAELSTTIESTYEQIFEYAVAQSREEEGTGAKFWETRKAELDRGYSRVSQLREELREAKKQATRTSADGMYIVLGEGLICEDVEFKHQAALLGNLIDGARRVREDPTTVLEIGSLGLIIDAERIEAIVDNLDRYAARQALNEKHPHQEEWLLVSAGLKVGRPHLSSIGDQLTKLSVVVYCQIESQPGEYQP